MTWGYPYFWKHPFETSSVEGFEVGGLVGAKHPPTLFQGTSEPRKKKTQLLLSIVLVG